mmetsp:Transcript_41714/g.110015  ORF Transcript_41714/g.110015 Transcript_41714/m.110015 type:complete len:290 (+) Transcript_41714:209-1078(+)
MHYLFAFHEELSFMNERIKFAIFASSPVFIGAALAISFPEEPVTSVHLWAFLGLIGSSATASLLSALKLLRTGSAYPDGEHFIRVLLFVLSAVVQSCSLVSISLYRSRAIWPVMRTAGCTFYFVRLILVGLMRRYCDAASYPPGNLDFVDSCVISLCGLVTNACLGSGVRGWLRSQTGACAIHLSDVVGWSQIAPHSANSPMRTRAGWGEGDDETDSTWDGCSITESAFSRSHKEPPQQQGMAFVTTRGIQTTMRGHDRGLPDVQAAFGVLLVCYYSYLLSIAAPSRPG